MDSVLDNALEILKKIEDKGFKAFIVGGFVRDKILGKDSLDVDITTNAKPKDLIEIFPQLTLPREYYEALSIIKNGSRFEIVTFRKDITYYKNRKPMKVEYISSLAEDLKRRDFTMNTLCIDSSGEIIDLLGGRKDIENHIIDTVGDANKKFKEDPLRILRAVRFYTILDFDLSSRTYKAILKTKKYLKNLSYDRKKEELNLIFASKNLKRGIDLIIKLGLDKDLEIYNLKDICLKTDLIGKWASLEISSKYPFTKSEKDLIKSIKEAKELNPLENKMIYDYGLYVASIIGDYHGISREEVSSKESMLPIRSRRDINIKTEEIMDILEKEEPGSYLNDIINEIQNKILKLELVNENRVLKSYVKRRFKDD